MNASCLDEKGRFVVLKSVEVKRVIDYDCEEGYAWK